MVINMDQEHKYFQMEIVTMVIMLMVNPKAKDLIFGTMVQFTKVNSKMD